MSSTRHAIETVYADRAGLTARERSAIDSLNANFADVRMPEEADVLTEFRRTLAKETREVLRSAIPDLEERGRAQRERLMPELDRLKGTAWQPLDDPGVRPAPSEPIVSGDDDPSVRYPHDPHQDLHFPPIKIPQPAHMGELWRASVSGFSSDPTNIAYNIDQDPLRIFGHLGYSGDRLLNGTVGLVMTFTLPPERMEITSRKTFAIDPDLRIAGTVSGYTGYYHPIFAADDKWSKCWEYVEATVTLSSGEWLAGNSLRTPVTDLADVTPVGMSNNHRLYGWLPGPLRFTADTFDLRRRGVSIILRTALRYDFQLEGESDIWFRDRGGSASESVPGFDNALKFRCSPGVVTSLP